MRSVAAHGVRTLTALLCALAPVTRALSVETTMPPGGYRLADVVFEVSRSSMLAGAGTTVRIGGDGRGVFIEELASVTDESGGSELVKGHATEFTVDPKDVFKLLEVCYQNRFFELEPHYYPPNVPQLGPNGEIRTMSRSVDDAGVTTVILRIGSYSKTVSYVDLSSPPSILVEIKSAIDAMRSRPVAK